jgi:hypothetical protein
MPGRRTIVLISRRPSIWTNDLIQEEMRAFGAALEHTRVVALTPSISTSHLQKRR